jgi:hypothetical protein
MVALKERGQVDPGRMVTHRLGFDVKDVIKVVMDVGASNTSVES